MCNIIIIELRSLLFEITKMKRSIACIYIYISIETTSAQERRARACDRAQWKIGEIDRNVMPFSAAFRQTLTRDLNCLRDMHQFSNTNSHAFARLCIHVQFNNLIRHYQTTMSIHVLLPERRKLFKLVQQVSQKSFSPVYYHNFLP